MIPKELLNKIMMPKIELEIEQDTPDLPSAIIAGMPMPTAPGEESEKAWAQRTDWFCYTDECLLFISCVSDDGKAWFIKQFNNLLSFESDKALFKYLDTLLQNAKSCEAYHYYIGECETAKLDEDETLQKILPENKLDGENKFKDYEVPVNLEDLTKTLKSYCTYKFKNPCGD